MRNEAILALGSGCSLGLEFEWRGDRHAHRFVLVGQGGDRTPQFESVEGSDAGAWPPSPPLQSLNLHSLADGRQAALLVGMAGRSHWSASIEPLVGQAGFQFDIACRLGLPEADLGSRYRLTSGEGADLSIAADGSWAEARSGERSLIITPENREPHRSRLLLDDGCLAIVPARREPPTVRWLYRIELLLNPA